MEVYRCNEFIGLVFSRVERTDDTIDFFVGNEEMPKYRLMHFQDCCEGVYVEDVDGDLSDLAGSPITLAERSTKDDTEVEYDSATWTFIRIGTAKGMVVIRFYGSSNGYYGEEADFAKRNEDGYSGYQSLYYEEVK